MKENIVKFLKKDGIYSIFCLAIIIYSFLVISISSKDGSYTVIHPFNNIYAMIAYIIIIVFGLLGFIFMRNIDIKQIKLEKIFLLLVIPIGIMFIITIPLGKIPDENTHMRRIVALADGIIFPESDDDRRVRVKYDESYYKIVNDKNNTYNQYHKVLNENSDYIGKIVEEKYTNMALYFPICHLPQVLGLSIVRLLGGNVVVQAYSARLTNFIVAIILIYWAIKLIPKKKHILLLISLLPITLNELVSLSADCITIAMSLFWIGYVFYLKLEPDKKEINKKDIIILTISSIIVSMCKIVYLPICLLIFIIPKQKLGGLKKKSIIFGLIFSISILINLVWIIYVSRFLIDYNTGVNSAEQALFILTHPINYIIILFRTIATYSQSFITGLCGAGISMLNVSVSETFLYPLILLLVVIFLTNDEREFEYDIFSRALIVFIFFAIILLIYTSLYVQWTAVAAPLINGVQARYFIPILLLTSFAFNNKFIIWNKNIPYRYIIMFMLFVNLNAISNIIYFYM